MVNSKPQDLSTSKKAGRAFIDKYKQKNPNDIIEELDLYTSDIPDINYKIFTSRATPVTGESYNNLCDEDKQKVDKINALCDQFLNADKYVIAAPMWSVMFPSILKRYLDCIIINGKAIFISENEVKGLLDNKERKMAYIQSSGGVYPKIISAKFNHGVNYIHDIFKFLGVKQFEKVMVEGVDMSTIGEEKALAKALKDIDYIIDDF